MLDRHKDFVAQSHLREASRVAVTLSPLRCSDVVSLRAVTSSPCGPGSRRMPPDGDSL